MKIYLLMLLVSAIVVAANMSGGRNGGAQDRA
jgi:hypothetical protein